MNKISFLIILFFALACKKEKKQEGIIAMYEDNVAPCSLDFTPYDYDSVYYSASQNFPNAQYRIKFGYMNGTYFEFAFNKIPTTGIYYTEMDINPSLEIDQVAFKQNYGAYGLMSLPTEPKSVYVEANSSYMTISFCNQHLRITDPNTWNTNIGDATVSLKVKKEF